MSDSRIRIALTVTALTLFVVRLIWPVTFANIDAVGLGLLAVAAIPWLPPIIEEFKIPGVFEAKLRDLESRVDRTQEDAQEAKQVAGDALETSQDLFLATPTNEMKQPAGVAPTAGLENLAAAYMKTRKSMPSGSERTAQMTALFHEMMGEARRIGKDNYNVRTGLVADDAGQNLASIAYLYTFPGTADVNDIVDCVERAKQPFVQYWGLKSIQKMLSAQGMSAFAPRDIERLRKLSGNIKPRTDRAFLLDRINSGLSSLLN